MLHLSTTGLDLEVNSNGRFVRVLPVAASQIDCATIKVPAVIILAAYKQLTSTLALDLGRLAGLIK